MLPTTYGWLPTAQGASSDWVSCLVDRNPAGDVNGKVTAGRVRLFHLSSGNPHSLVSDRLNLVEPNSPAAASAEKVHKGAAAVRVNGS